MSVYAGLEGAWLLAVHDVVVLDVLRPKFIAAKSGMGVVTEEGNGVSSPEEVELSHNSSSRSSTDAIGTLASGIAMEGSVSLILASKRGRYLVWPPRRVPTSRQMCFKYSCGGENSNVWSSYGTNEITSVSEHAMSNSFSICN